MKLLVQRNTKYYCEKNQIQLIVRKFRSKFWMDDIE
jgi:hypothetical protein